MFPLMSSWTPVLPIRNLRFHAFTRFLPVMMLVAISGCLPSPHKPIGAARSEDKQSPTVAAPTPTVVARPVEKVVIPVFEPAPTASTPFVNSENLNSENLNSENLNSENLNSGNLNSENFEMRLPSNPQPPLVKNANESLDRLKLSSDTPDKKPFSDGLPPIDQLPTSEPSLSLPQSPTEPKQDLADIVAPVTPTTPTTPIRPVSPLLPLDSLAAEQSPISPQSSEKSSPTKSSPILLIPESPTAKPLAAEVTAPSASTAVTASVAPGASIAPRRDPLSKLLTPISDSISPPAAPANSLAPSLDPTNVPVVDVRNGTRDSVSDNRLRRAPLPLIPREEIFRRSERSSARISPDGKLFAFLAERNGVVNVFVAPVGDLNAATPVTNDSNDGVQNFLWAFTGRHILFLKSAEDNGMTHVHCVNLDTSEIKDLTPIANASAYVAAASHKLPAEIMVAICPRQPYQFYDIYRVNIVTGDRQLVQENNRYSGFEIDDDYRIRIAHRRSPDGGRVFAKRNGPDAPWKDFLVANPEDALGTGVVGFDATGEQVYFVDSRQTDRSILKVIDLAGDREKRLAEHPLADVTGTLVHPTEKQVQAVTFTHDRQKWEVLDDRINVDLEYLHTVEEGELEITSRTLDDTLWTVVFRRDDGPAKSYLYRREPRSTKLLFHNRPGLVDLPLAKMHPLSIPTRDGLNMVSYLTLPPGSDTTAGQPDHPLPMVLLVHGGPWARDVWGYSELHQLLANRGYAVLSVNYRGSTGFGKSFTNAGNREWAGKMHEDLVDSVKWAVDRRIAQQNRIAIMGGSYGGYATLVGLTFTPEIFACGIDIVGPSSLVTLLENPLAQWSTVAPLLSSRVGDLNTPQGRDFLMSRSPIRFVDRIARPLLIAQGANDAVAQKAEADRMVDSMRASSVPVTYLVYPDEGHGFKRPANRMAFYAVAEAFLADHLGGRAEPIGATLGSSSVQIPTGREHIRALTGANLGLDAGTATLPTLNPQN